MSASSAAMRRPRVLLADDHAATADQLRCLLLPHFDVVGQVHDGYALVSAAERLSPDVIVTDISMPGLDGVEALALIRQHDPSSRVVFVTIHSDPAMVERSLSDGAMGYVLKDGAGDDLVAAVFAALRGDRYVSEAIKPAGWGP